MSTSDREPKRMKADGGPMGGPLGPPPDGYYGGPPPGGRYAPYGGPPPPMGSGYNMWGQPGHGPPPHGWSHGSPTPPPGPLYGRGGPGMTPSDRPGYGAAYPPRGPPPPMPGPGGPRSHSGKASGPGGPSPSLSSRPKPSDGSAVGTPPSDNGPHGPMPPGSFPQGGYYPPPGGPYGTAPYPPSGPPGPYGGVPYPSGPPPGYANSPPRTSSGGQGRPRSSPDMMTGFCQTTETDNPDIDSLFSTSRGGHDDDGTGSQSGDGRGHNSKDKGRGSYKCGRCGVPKKGHVCPYQPKLTRRPGEPLPEMRSAAIQVEMDEFMTMRRLNLRIQGFPESYANEPYGEDMVIGEPHPPMTVHSPHGGPHEMMSIGDNGHVPTLPVHDPVTGVLGSPIRSTPMSEGDAISGAA